MNDDPRLAELGQFTPEGHLQPGYGDHYVFFVGRDDCHGILHHLIPQERLLFKLNMFGYDDDELNADIMGLFDDPAVHVQATLDRSQAGGVHERKIVEFDQETNSEDFNYSFAIGQSETHQISHTKGGILVGQGIGFEGSMNWSDSGEGTGISLRADVANPVGFKAQNNTLMVSTNPVFLSRFGARLDVEHRVAVQQAHDRAVKAARGLAPRKRAGGRVGDGVSAPAPAVAPATPSGVYVPPNVALAPVVPGQVLMNPAVTVQPGDLQVGSYADVKEQLLNSHRAAFDPRSVR